MRGTRASGLVEGRSSGVAWVKTRMSFDQKAGVRRLW